MFLRVLENNQKASVHLKLLPNLITALRLALSPTLLFLPLPSTIFFAVYLLCGVSDMVDGALARIFKSESKLGAYLDSAADFVFIAIMLFRLFPVIAPNTILTVWIIIIAAVRVAAASTAFFRHGVFAFLHTNLNKFTGLLLFIFPLTLALRQSAFLTYFLCAVATLSAAEELAIDLSSKEWDVNRKSILKGGHGSAL